MTSILQPDLEQKTLRLYGELLCRRQGWSGQLTLAAFAGAAASGLAAASSLAGAASLTVDADSSAVKAHFRDGAFDFVVTTLDEAVRALKNEVRRGRSVAIGLIADPAQARTEAIERGLCARLVLTDSSEPDPQPRQLLSDDGTLLLGSTPSTTLTEWLGSKGWIAATVPEQHLLADTPTDDPRHRWLRDLPTHQRSAAKAARWLWTAKPA